MIGQVCFTYASPITYEKNPMNLLLGTSPKKNIKKTRKKPTKKEVLRLDKFLFKDESKPTNKYIYTYIYIIDETLLVLTSFLFILLLLRFFTVFHLPMVDIILGSLRQKWVPCLHHFSFPLLIVVPAPRSHSFFQVKKERH